MDREQRDYFDSNRWQEFKLANVVISERISWNIKKLSVLLNIAY